ncbi:MAG: sensor histidine kinase [Lachnospiraceae bacterium]|nr:sensor histidine kinase [Lachnospiraceae bacterium]
MVLLTSLILDAALTIIGLAKRRGGLWTCRFAALSVIVNMSALYVSNALAAEFGDAVLPETACAAAAKIFVIAIFLQKTEPAERVLPGYLLSIGISLCVHSAPAAGLLCELLLLIYLLHAESTVRKELKQEAKDRAGFNAGGNDLYLQTIEESYRKNRTLMHDLNNHAIAMHALAANGEYEDLMRYIDTFSRKVRDNMFPVRSGSIVLDAVLADKYHRAAGLGISVIFEQIRYSSDLENEDLCTVVGNLFDNAIEENMKCRDAGQRRISICILSDEDTLQMTVKNPLFHELKVKNGLPVSEKPDVEHHGMGLRNVRRVCDRYNGTLIWDVLEQEFTVTAYLHTK